MKHQQVSVDYWVMLKTMFTYGLLTIMGWIMLRLFNTVFTLPGRLRTSQQNLQDTLEELQRRYPNMNITEEDLKEAEKEYESMLKEEEEKTKAELADKTTEATSENCPIEEDKKTI